MNKKTILIITDGIGYKENKENNAFEMAKKPNYDYLFKNAPYSLLHTYGEYVGLPKNQMGNSEVGHMCIGSGRILYQDLVKINKAVKDDTLKDNKILNKTINNSNNMHLIGIASDGGVHGHIEHLIALAKICEASQICKARQKKVFLHLITDGRDVSFDSAMDYLEQIEKITNENIQIASISGRYYAMDRDNRWERIKQAYDAISSALPKTESSFKQYLEQNYKHNIYDEFIVPSAFGDYDGFMPNDGVIYCNFRSDRARELSHALISKDFNHFAQNKTKINLTSMTQYDKKLNIDVLFTKKKPENTLAEVIASKGLKQYHTAETEKYAHVTFFFNGGVEEPVLNEDRCLIPSPKVATYDLMPQMSAEKVGQSVLSALDKNYDFIVVNFANGDMVGHTGKLEASIKAVETIDEQLGKIIKKAKQEDYNFILTSDHGNCEQMIDKNGKILTSHTVGDVYCWVLADGVKSIKAGGLNNIAASVLKLMDIEKPTQMDEALF